LNFVGNNGRGVQAIGDALWTSESPVAGTIYRNNSISCLSNIGYLVKKVGDLRRLAIPTDLLETFGDSV